MVHRKFIVPVRKVPGNFLIRVRDSVGKGKYHQLMTHPIHSDEIKAELPS